MPRESPVNAPVSVRAKAVTGTTPSSSKSPVVGLSLNGVALTPVGTDLSSYPANTATEFATLDRDREYDLQINSVYVGDVEIYFDLPAGLRLLIDGRPLLTHNYDGGNVATGASETVKIVVTSGRPPLRAGEEFDVIRSAGYLRQIKTGSILTDIVVNTQNSEFEIRFYKKGDFIEELSGGLYPVRANTDPSVKHVVKNPNSS